MTVFIIIVAYVVVLCLSHYTTTINTTALLNEQEQKKTIRYTSNNDHQTTYLKIYHIRLNRPSRRSDHLQLKQQHFCSKFKVYMVLHYIRVWSLLDAVSEYYIMLICLYIFFSFWFFELEHGGG